MTPAEQFEKIIDAYQAIKLDGTITILTGSNGSGKSLIRNQLFSRVRDEIRPDAKIIHASQELRTQINSNLGGLSMFAHDLGHLPTSIQTIDNIRKATETAARSANYLVIDEPEIGCGEETVLALVDWLNDNILNRDDLPYGILIITHSRHMVAGLNHDEFLNLDGFESAEDWLNRPLVKTNLEALQANELYDYIQANSRKKS